MKGGNNMSLKNKLIIAAVVVAIVVIIGYLIYANEPIVSAQGDSSLKAQPDEISVYLTIDSKNLTIQDAQKTNSFDSSSVISALKALGYSDKDIQLNGYSSYPWQDWNGTSYEDKGYIVSQQLIVKTENFSDTFKIVNAAVDNGAIVQSINFELSQDKQNQYKAQALHAASENAKEKATSIAAGQGKRIGFLISIQSNDFSYYPRPIYTMQQSTGAGAVSSDSSASAAEAKQASVNISPSDLDVSVSVTAEYKLSPF